MQRIQPLSAKHEFPLPARYPALENPFLARQAIPAPLPAYDPDLLPALIADDHPTWITTYHKAWEIAFGNLRQPEPSTGFVSNFIDTAFNKNTFMWDSCFMTMFGRYGRRVFDFMGTLDNFYAKQHQTGFICREISTYTGDDFFSPFDPRGTGPNIMAWTEWIDYQTSGDVERLRAVFPALVAYHRWWKDWRTWPDGGYWTTGLGSGMDNQNRIPDSSSHHRHYSWADTTFQQALNCRMLLNAAGVIDRHEFDAELQTEYAHLRDYVNARMWDERAGFYFDVASDRTLSPIKSIGAYWGLLAGLVPPERAARMVANLDDPALFNRPHRIPSQAADSGGGYRADGGYWLGGVWAPTNYMVLRALTEHGHDDLAFAIALNHVDNVAAVFQDTGTLWENYAPESTAPGQPAKGDFVGWTGVSAIAVPLEYLVGLRPDTANQRLLWDIRLTERHGVLRYPLGQTNTIDLVCESRSRAADPPRLTVTTREAFTLEIRWSGGREIRSLSPGTHQPGI
jgi:hypothetical protein